MFNFCSLYSGSSGNSLFVESKNTKILIDAGVSCKKIEQALQDINVDPSTLDGILVTHEHRDHVQSLGTISKKFDLPVFVNQETLDAMPAQRDKIAEKNIKLFKVDDKFEVGDLLIKPFAIPHDAANPCGFSVYKDKSKIVKGTIKNISERGIGIYTDNPDYFKINDKVQIKFWDKDNELLLSAEVKRKHKSLLGLEFNRLSPTEMQNIISIYIDNLAPYYDVKRQQAYIYKDEKKS